jgi:hypothetical protein
VSFVTEDQQRSDADGMVVFPTRLVLRETSPSRRRSKLGVTLVVADAGEEQVLFRRTYRFPEDWPAGDYRLRPADEMPSSSITLSSRDRRELLEAEQGEVEHEAEYPWGHVRFLDETVAQRVALVSSQAVVREEGLLRVTLDLTSRKRSVGICVWAVFLDERGEEAERSPVETYRLREGRIESVSTSSRRSAREVVVYIDED